MRVVRTSVVSALSAALVLFTVPAAASFDSVEVDLAQDKQVRTADPAKRGFKLTDFPRTSKLAENVYGYEDLHPAGMPTVSLFVIGDDGVLIADGQANPTLTKRMLDEIARITPKPLKWYIVGSDHGDHTAGNSALPAGITYVVSKASQAQMKLSAPAMASDQETIDIGGMEVQAIFAGRAHTGGDLLVYLPKQKILFMSEVYLNRVFPAMRSAYPTEWISVIDKALAMDVDLYVPGHGFIETAKVAREELVEYRQAMRYVIAEVTRLHKRGLSAEDAAKQANWGPYQDWYLAQQQGPIAVRKIYEEIEGKLK